MSKTPITITLERASGDELAAICQQGNLRVVRGDLLTEFNAKVGTVSQHRTITLNLSDLHPARCRAIAIALWGKERRGDTI